jgi:hypothetical protein
VLKPTEIKSQNGTTLAVQTDGSILASGVNPEKENYTIAAQPGLASITALRLETLPHSSLPKGGSGRDPNGSFFLNELTVNVSQPASGESSAPWKFKSAIASFHRTTMTDVNTRFNLPSMVSRARGGTRGPRSTSHNRPFSK